MIIGSIQDIAVTGMAPDANILRMTSQTDLLAALESGKVDVAGSESLSLDFNREIADKVDSVGAGLESIPVAAIFKRGNTALQQDFHPARGHLSGHAAVQLYQFRQALWIGARPADGVGQP